MREIIVNFFTAEPRDSPAPASSLAASSPNLTLAALLIRIEALKGETQHLRDDLQQAKTELATARSELAESEVALDTRLQERTSHYVARETAVKDELRQLVSAEGLQLGAPQQASQGQQCCHARGAGQRNNQQASRPHAPYEGQAGCCSSAQRLYSCTIPAPSQSVQAVIHVGRPGSNKRPVLVEFSTHTAKHDSFKLSP